jgi:hypothetical protein
MDWAEALNPPLPEVTPRCFALFLHFTGAPPVPVPIARLHCKKNIQ